MWNVEIGCPLKVYVEHSDAVLSIIFSSSDANYIISGSRDQSLHIWHIEQHTQAADQPLPCNMIEDDEPETNSNNDHKKRHNKPRPNRAEREKKRAAKGVELSLF